MSYATVVASAKFVMIQSVCLQYFAGSVVNYGISNTIVLEIP